MFPINISAIGRNSSARADSRTCCISTSCIEVPATSESNINWRFSSSSAEEEEKRQFMFDSLVAGTSMQEVLMQQVRESALAEELRPIAEMLIGNIDDYGYLKESVEELAASTGLPAEKIQ